MAEPAFMDKYQQEANQNSIRSIFAISSVRQTNSENPSALLDRMISRYCGIYGTTPPKIIRHEAMTVTRSCKLMPNTDTWFFVVVMFNIRVAQTTQTNHRITTTVNTKNSLKAGASFRFEQFCTHVVYSTAW